jgi:hypothetical protein
MNGEEVFQNYSKAIESRFRSYCRFHEIGKAEIEHLHCDMVAEIYFAAPSMKAPKSEKRAGNYVSQIVYYILVDLWRERLTVTFGKGKEQSISSISEFSEELLANKLDFGEYRDRGGCSHFTEDDSHSPFPGFEDLNEYDQAIIEEFCSQAVDNSRRLMLRRLVNSILIGQGIDSEKIHEYTARRNRKPT